MAERPMRILQVSTADILGGAEKVAWDLFHACRAHGYGSWLAVGRKCSDDPDVLLVPNDDCRSRWARIGAATGNMLSPLAGRVRGVWRLRHGLYWIGQPRRWLEIQRGYEDFDYPSTWRLLTLPPKHPHIVHCHNLHGAYFDLRVLPWMSGRVSVILTLHDAWLLSGHCAHSFDCERWETGCGHCPDLTIYPPVRRDATAYNWRRKREIYTKSRFYVATPSRWLMQKVEHSMLAPAVVEARVIPNGVDLSVFHPADRQAVRAALGIPQDAKVLLFTAIGVRRNIWKDYQTMRAAIAQVAEYLPTQGVLFIALGEDAPGERIGQAELRFVPYQEDREDVARYYQAADVYVHATRADTFPITVLEALACGTPVVATAVGGIPEQIKGLRISDFGFRNSDLNEYGMDEATGLLVPSGDAKAMATAIKRLLSDEVLRSHLGENAAQDACQRFDLRQQVYAYLQWYQAIMERHNLEPSTFQSANVQRGSYALSNSE
jgi:glycosyltransferase involved in cell wall biosynthesis